MFKKKVNQDQFRHCSNEYHWDNATEEEKRKAKEYELNYSEKGYTHSTYKS